MSIQPSALLLSKLTKIPSKKRLLDQILKEFEVYNYFSERVPFYLNDQHWERILNTETISQRVQLWNFFALTQKREINDSAKKDVKREKTELKTSENYAAFNSGGMAYGSNFYRLMLNPFRIKKCADDVIYSKFVTNYIVNDMPKIFLDTQYVQDVPNRDARLLGEQAEKLLEANFYYSKRSFPVKFINANRGSQNMSDFFRKIGFCTRDKKRFNEMLPDIHDNNPYYNIMKNNDRVPEKDQIIYLSRHAKKMLDGPLIHKAYVIPISWDKDKESLNYCRRNRIQAMCLPIDKYIKWQSGPKAVPFVNILKILINLTFNGCNWERALRDNIAKRHLIPTQELIEKMNIHQHKQREHRDNTHKIVNLIEEAVRESLEC